MNNNGIPIWRTQSKILVSFKRADTGVWEQIGPGVQAGVSGGYELVADKLVLAGSVVLIHEWPLSSGGTVVADSDATNLTASVSSSWKVTSHWTVTGSVSTDVLGRLGISQNRPERLAVTLGIRYGFF